MFHPVERLPRRGDPTPGLQVKRGSTKRLIASLALGGSLLGGGIAIPLALTAQSAYAAPGNSEGHEHADHHVLAAKAQQHVEVTPACTIFRTGNGVFICV
jgi:hypothetical protein